MVFDYYHEQKESIPCNLCGGNDAAILAQQSKNGLSATTVICKRCGLIYISPRMRRAGYDAYYKHYYRADRDSIKGTESEQQTALNFDTARRFALALAKRWQPFLLPGLTIDVGSSTGGLLYGLRETVPTLELLGVEPSLSESAYAESKGVRTVTALFEDFVEADKASTNLAANILCVQSLNHLLDPIGFMRWAHGRLQDGGHLLLAVKNFRHQARRAGKVSSGVQIDHPYMFTPETLRRMVGVAGFEVVYFDVDEGKPTSEIETQRREGMHRHHVRIVGRKVANSKPFAPTREDHATYRHLRFALTQPMLKLHHLWHYSRRVAQLKRLTIGL
jgi:SAM-dependent methyltransferase